MKIVIAILGSLLLGATACTFPGGALDRLDVALKSKVDANNARFPVDLVLAYATGQAGESMCSRQEHAAERSAEVFLGLSVRQRDGLGAG